MFDEGVPDCLAITLFREVDVAAKVFANSDQNASVRSVSAGQLLKPVCDDSVQCSIDVTDGLGIRGRIEFLKATKLALH